MAGSTEATVLLVKHRADKMEQCRVKCAWAVCSLPRGQHWPALARCSLTAVAPIAPMHGVCTAICSCRTPSRMCECAKWIDGQQAEWCNLITNASLPLHSNENWFAVITMRACSRDIRERAHHSNVGTRIFILFFFEIK